MKIVEIINGLQKRGGAEVFLASLSTQLQANPDCKVFVISLFGGVDESFKMSLNEKGVVLLTCNKKQGIDFKAARTFKRMILDINPDIIHFHLSCLPVYYLAFGLRKRKWLVFETFHSIPGANVGKLKTLLRKTYIKKGLLTFIGISNEITIMAKKLYPEINCFTISNGVSLNETPKLKADKKYDFIIVASLIDVKNHSLLFEAMK